MDLGTIYGQIGRINAPIRQIAKDTDISPMTIWRILNGRTDPKLGDLVMLQKAGYIKICCEEDAE